VRLLTGLTLPEDERENNLAIGRGEARKVRAEEPWFWDGRADTLPRSPQAPAPDGADDAAAGTIPGSANAKLEESGE